MPEIHLKEGLDLCRHILVDLSLSLRFDNETVLEKDKENLQAVIDIMEYLIGRI